VGLRQVAATGRRTIYASTGQRLETPRPLDEPKTGEDSMKRNLSIFFLTATIALLLTACWNPSVAEVPLTSPWDKMNLPINENARVWASDDKTLKVVYKAPRREVAKSYLDALEKDGWKLTDQPDVSEHSLTFKFAKSGQNIEVYVYDFENTGVMIEKK
jgi:hypothetical protein